MFRLMLGLVFVGLLPLCAEEAVPAKPALKYDAVERYAEQQIEGWRVLVHRDLFLENRTELRERTLKLLGNHLFRITTIVPDAAVVQLRKIPIWVEVAHPRHPCMCYHPDAGWLQDNDMNPAKAGGVELANCENFLNWTRDQPWMVLHEMAHGYHHQYLPKGFDNPQILAVYQSAKQARLYDSILRINGKKEKAYALNNQQEYFAEQTEAFFGTNDFFPFVKAELREHDPQMHELLEKLWKIK
jgi:hypothetical protein